VDRSWLEDAYASVDRAQGKTKELDAEIRTFRKRHSHSIVEGRDPESGAYVLTVHPQEVPKPIRQASQEIVMAMLRPALDYLIRDLAWFDSGKRPSKTQFPIIDAPKEFRRKRNTWLRGVSDEHAAGIERLQPYDGRQRWIALLRDLSNPSKHDEIMVIDSTIRGGYEVVERTRRVRLVNRAKPPPTTYAGKPDARLGALSRGMLERRPQPETKPLRSRISVPRDHPLARSDVHVHLGLSFVVAFPQRLPVIQTLKALEEGVRLTLDVFKPEFETPPARTGH
jgi:hypothetical protein